MALTLGMRDDERVYLITRCGDVIEVSVRQARTNHTKMQIDAPREILIQHERLKNAPGRACSVEEQLAELGLYSPRVDAIDWRERLLEGEEGRCGRRFRVALAELGRGL